MLKKLFFFLCMCQVCMCQVPNAIGQASYFNIYIDADFSNHLESSVSIERGLKVALKSTNSRIMGREVRIIRKDHRGNSKRSLRHMKAYLKDPNSLLMLSGIHSPPLLAHRSFINENAILFLVPWAAAGPITRYPSKENWLFRLSIDDSKAGKFISHYAIKEQKYKKPYLMLEDTGWGRSNFKTMSKSLKELGIKDFKVGWFNWNLKKAGANVLISNAQKAGSDVIFLVSNALEGRRIAQELALKPVGKRIPILSHWGITGGNFHKTIPYEIRKKINLKFIQTSFSFVNREMDAFELSVLEKAKGMFSSIKSAKDITAMPGFVHAHDLGLLLIEACK